MRQALLFCWICALLAPGHSGWAQGRDWAGEARLAELLATGEAFGQAGDHRRAVDALEAAVEVLSQVAAGDELALRSVPVRRALAWNLVGMGDPEAAIEQVLAIVVALRANQAPPPELELLVDVVETAVAQAARRGGYPSGDALRVRVEQALDPDRDGRLLARLQHERGRAARAMGETDAAIAAYGEAIRLRRELADFEGLAWSLTNRGYVLMASTTRLEEAAADHGAAAALVREHDLSSVESRVTGNIQLMVHVSRTVPGLAAPARLLSIVGQCLDDVPSGPTLDRAWLAGAELSLLRSSEERADPSRLRAAGERLVAAAVRPGDAAWLALGHLAVGEAARMSGADPDAVEASLSAAADAGAASGDPSPIVSVRFERARALYAVEDAAAARRMVESALDLCDAHGLRMAAIEGVRQVAPGGGGNRDPELVAACEAWAARAEGIRQAPAGIRSTGSYPATPVELLRLSVEAPLCRAVYTLGEDRGPRWRIAPLLSSRAGKSVELAAGGQPTWVRVPGFDLLLRGCFLQIAGTNVGKGEIRPAEQPVWDPMNRTFCLEPGMTAVIHKNGDVVRTR